MIKSFISSFISMFSFLKTPLIIIFAVVLFFYFLVFLWVLYYRLKGYKLPKHDTRRIKKRSVIIRLLWDLPKRIAKDKYERVSNQYPYKGIHMFCGAQGSGKTIAAVEMIMRHQYQYPHCKVISNFGYKNQDSELYEWQQLLNYNNGKLGVICGIDEIQNWFASGKTQLPDGMLEIVTQNRKNSREIICTSQVFTRVNKGLREQVSMVYQPHTFFGALTVVIKRFPEFDSEGNVIKLKYKGMYFFVHTKELREAYDTYLVIHRLSQVEKFIIPNQQEV